MQHALELAHKGVALASPNPTVGCVIVRDGGIVGEGFHQYERRDHAEIVALESAKEKARGAVLYVTLEPCSHQGRTGPCTEAIIAAGIARVVAATEDPNPVGPRRRRLLRAVLDSKLRMRPNSRVVNTAEGDLLVLTAASLRSPKARKLQDVGVEVVRTKSKKGRMDLPAILAELGRREMLSVLLEAGPTLNGAALAAGIVPTLVLF